MAKPASQLPTAEFDRTYDDRSAAETRAAPRDDGYELHRTVIEIVREVSPCVE